MKKILYAYLFVVILCSVFTACTGANNHIETVTEQHQSSIQDETEEKKDTPESLPENEAENLPATTENKILDDPELENITEPIKENENNTDATVNIEEDTAEEDNSNLLGIY